MRLFNLFLKFIESFSSFLGKIDNAIIKGSFKSFSDISLLGSKDNPIHFVVDSKKEKSLDKE